MFSGFIIILSLLYTVQTRYLEDSEITVSCNKHKFYIKGLFIITGNRGLTIISKTGNTIAVLDTKFNLFRLGGGHCDNSKSIGLMLFTFFYFSNKYMPLTLG